MNFVKVKSLDCKQAAVRSVRYNNDGDYCVTAGSDKTVKLWNPQKSLLLKKYEGHHSDVLDAAASHDNANLVSGGTDKTVILWDVTRTEPVRKIRGHYGAVHCVAFNADSTVALSGSSDHTVRAWDLRSRSKEPVQVLDDARDSVQSVAVSDHEIVSGSLDCKVRRYDLRVGVMNMDDMKAAVSNVCFTRDGQCILSNCLNNCIKLFDAETGGILQEFRGHVNCKFRVDGCLLKNDEIVLSGSEDGHVYAWSLTEAKLLQKMSHARHRVVHSLTPHPKNLQFLAASEALVYMWQEASLSDPLHE